MSPIAIGLIGFDGATATHLTSAADAFASAALDDGFGGRICCYKVWILGLTNAPFVSEAGITFQPHKSLATAPSLDTIIVAGGNGVRRPLVQDRLAEWILQRSSETRRIASICSGIYALASTGLLDGREVTTHWRCSRSVQERYPALRVGHKRSLIKDGPFYTSAGLTAGIGLACALIEEDYGQQVAHSVGRNLMTHLFPAEQPNESSDRLEYESQSTDRLGHLVPWIMRNLDQSLTVEMLARRAGMCPSHFTRAFKSVFGTTPGDFVENLRLNEAQRRLASRHKTLRSVAASVGFTDANAFRRAFARRFGITPRLRSDRLAANDAELVGR
jgi:transcriptional regulator GlxA family with amidase domain